MTEPSGVSVTLLVLHSYRMEECRDFYGRLGLSLSAERHGNGPGHYAAVLADGTVFEIYPARAGRETGVLRLGLAVSGAGATPPLPPGRHLLTDPDGRTVQVDAT